MADDAQVLDRGMIEKLRKLEALAAPGLVKQVIELFLGPLDARIARLKSLAAAADAPGVESEAHALKGVAAQVGAGQVAAACGALEAAAREQDLSDAAGLVARLEDAAVQARAALAKEL